MTDTRNVLDRYKNWNIDYIKADLLRNSFNYGILMEQFQGDFNIGSVFRSANINGVKEIFYIGKKRWDKRGAVGVNHYSSIFYLKNVRELEALKKRFTFIGVETINKAKNLYDYKWNKLKKPPLFIFGEEGVGITPEVMLLCDDFIICPMFGTVRSYNAASCATLVMSEYVNRYLKRNICYKIKKWWYKLK